MFFCDPWNPAPIQSRPGLLNDPNAIPNQVENGGCFDQVSVPPVFIVNGKTLVRSTYHSGGTGWIKNALRDHAKALFGERRGAFMWDEFNHGEFFWNRAGVGNPGGISRSFALWIEEPDPKSIFSIGELIDAGVDPEDLNEVGLWLSDRRIPKLFLGTCFFHGQAGYNAKTLLDLCPPVRSWTMWAHDKLPNDPSFDPDYFTQFSDPPGGYPVWAAECIDIGPNPWGREQSPYALAPMVFRGRSWRASGGRQIAVPAWS